MRHLVTVNKIEETKRIDKATFKKLMTDFMSLKKDEEKVCEAMKKLVPDFGYFSLGRYETLFLQTMKEAMNDKYDNISYWCYDLEFGSKSKKDSITDKNGKYIPIKTLDDLYNIIATR